MIWLIGNKGMLGTEVEELLKKEGLSYVSSDQEVDITNIHELQRFATDKSIDWIINCAAYTAVDRVEDESDLAFRINADGPYNIAKIVKNLNAKLIHISTDYVFDGTTQEAHLETDTPKPIGIYGKSKHKGEVNITETITNFFIIRTAWLYGKNGNNFVYTMLRLFKGRDEISVVGDQYGSPTYAPDLAKALLNIVLLNSTHYGIYHFSNEGRISWYDFACEIYRLAKEDILESKIVNIKKTLQQIIQRKLKDPKILFYLKKKLKM